MITPAQPGAPSVRSFQEIAWKRNGKWVGSLWNRQTKGPGRPPGLCIASLAADDAVLLVVVRRLGVVSHVHGRVAPHLGVDVKAITDIHLNVITNSYDRVYI